MDGERTSDPVTARLLASRVELLDLTLRNPLLNWRASVRRGVEVTDESARQIFDTLVLQGQSLRFHHTKTSPPKAGAPAPGLEVAEFEVGTGEANPENSLATPCTKEDLARRLQATHYDARTSIEEQGANILFLALGMLRWREAEAAPETRLAPLVLAPVRLERKTARAAWHLLAADEDPGANLSLVEKLRDFGLRIPAEPDLESVEGLEAFLAEVEHAVGEREGWGVERNRIVLGFFSFGKFLMYRDLDPAVWPAELAPSRHEVLSGLLVEGFRDPGGAIGPDDRMDEKRPPGRIMEVMDTDGSQAEALADVAGGRNLVIQGPPGTGKSQTISNLIAEAVHAGKRVLFVAEKMAALEVVKRRLDNVGLGDLCLELHSSKASKKEVAEELFRTLSLGKPAAPAGADLVEALPALRERLNRYAQAASLPVARTGMTPFQAIGILERLSADSLPRIDCPALASWDAARFAEARTKAEDLAAKVSEIGVPARHPFAGCGLVRLVPGDEEKIAAALDEALGAGRAVVAAAQALAVPFAAPPAADPAALEAWIRLAALGLEAPDLRGVPAVGAAWDRAETAKAFEAGIEAGRSLAQLLKDHEARLLPQAWDQDLLQARADLVADGSSWWRRLFSGRYREAKRRVQGLCHPPVPARPYELLTTANAVLEGQRLRGEVERRAEAGRSLVGAQWQGVESDWEALARLDAWAVRFRRHLATAGLPAQLADWVTGPWDREALRAAHGQAERAVAAWRGAWGKVGTLLAFRGDLAAQAFAPGSERAGLWRAGLGKLPAYVAYWRIDREAAALGLEPLAEQAHRGTLPAARLQATLEQAWARRVADEAFRERAELRDFDAVSHEQAVERFRAADRATFEANRARLAEAHWRRLPGLVGYGQVGLVRREGAKKARHLPIRRLLEEAGEAVQQLKPVFLMSPLSIAAYLPPGGPVFDLVVFDEASQVKPVDAFGAILRGRRLVVVGDEKQMPPTSFFDHLLEPGDRRPEDDEEAAASVTQDLQSILGLCTSRGMPSRMLRWHYRSRHDSLIALSNREFYESHLVVFPSPRRNEPGEGLAFRHLADTVYERGTSRTNPREADAVAQAALEHARARPELSLGIVAFSVAQRGAIEDRIEALCRKDAAFDAFVRQSRDEPFFVKNLENVQGDERDVMLISVGYGRDEKGLVTMNFGPLNQAGGERRLNVLITRARRQCVVFTNLTADDLDLRRAAGEGVRVFKAFLAFARDGRMEVPAATGAGHDSEFEEQVHRALEKKGYQVEPQVGSGGFRVDLGVVDPEAPGRYLLGIECDGAKYHSARWARDRDRLRESVLRSLGWRIHRIWSTDWFRSRDEALRRSVEAIERAKEAKSAPRPPAPSVPVAREPDSPPAGRAAPPAYVPVQASANIGDRHLAEVNPEKLAEFVAAIVNRESPVHLEEVRRRVLGAVDARAGSKRVAAIDEAVERAVSRGLVRRKGDFLWGREDREIVPRDRSSLPDASRDLEVVAYEERRAALLRVVEESCGCADDEAAVQAIKLLGVKRNDDALARLAGLVRQMAGEGAFARTPSGALVPARRIPR